MNDKLLKKYLEYASTDEAFAVLFVKKHLVQVKGHWVDVVACRRYEMSADNLHFRFVIGGLYKRKIQPQYPPKSAYTVDGKFDERGYYLMTRAITWETAHKDIGIRLPIIHPSLTYTARPTSNAMANALTFCRPSQIALGPG